MKTALIIIALLVAIYLLMNPVVLFGAAIGVLATLGIGAYLNGDKE